MKTNYWRLLLTYMLILALPIQGIAQGRMLMASAIQPVIMQDVNNSAPMDPHCSKHQQSTASSDTQKIQTSHSASKLHCSHMSPCCAGAVMISHALNYPLSQFTSGEFLLSATHYPSTLLDRLDRPPRFFLA